MFDKPAGERKKRTICTLLIFGRQMGRLCAGGAALQSISLALQCMCREKKKWMVVDKKVCLLRQASSFSCDFFASFCCTYGLKMSAIFLFRVTKWMEACSSGGLQKEKNKIKYMLPKEEQVNNTRLPHAKYALASSSLFLAFLFISSFWKAHAHIFPLSKFSML